MQAFTKAKLYSENINNDLFNEIEDFKQKKPELKLDKKSITASLPLGSSLS